MKRQSSTFQAIVVASILTLSSDSSAAILFESGTLGPTGLTFADFDGGGAPDGSGVSTNVFSAVRFEISQPVITTQVGGHFVIEPGAGTSFFGAIVQLDSITDFPDSGDLSTSDLLGHAILDFPNTSSEIFGDLELQLEPGIYALAFGSGLFGTTGSGGAVLNNPDIGSPSYVGYQPAANWFEISSLPGPFENFRLIVKGIVVPEPNSIAISLLALMFSTRLRRTRPVS